MRTLVVEFIPFNTIDTFDHGKRRNAGSPNKYYEYLYVGDRKVIPGDWAIVHNGSEFGCVEVQRIKPGLSDKATKHIITVITQEDFKAYQEANRHISKHRQVFDELDYMLENEKKLDKYRDLAERNPQAKNLLDSLNIWNGPVLEAQNAEPVFEEKPAEFTMNNKPADADSPDAS